MAAIVITAKITIATTRSIATTTTTTTTTTLLTSNSTNLRPSPNFPAPQNSY